MSWFGVVRFGFGVVCCMSMLAFVVVVCCLYSALFRVLLCDVVRGSLWWVV